jgi:hypothetical protein
MRNEEEAAKALFFLFLFAMFTSRTLLLYTMLIAQPPPIQMEF